MYLVCIVSECYNELSYKQYNDQNKLVIKIVLKCACKFDG